MFSYLVRCPLASKGFPFKTLLGLSVAFLSLFYRHKSDIRISNRATPQLLLSVTHGKYFVNDVSVGNKPSATSFLNGGLFLYMLL